MKYLLDTHILIWALFADEKLSKKSFKIINDPKNILFYSTASIWEIVIKHSKSPNKIPVSGEEVVKFCQKANIKPLPIIPEHTLAIATLVRKPHTPEHNDPFDRLLIAQAKIEDMNLLTHDKLLTEYKERNIFFV